MFSNLRQNSTIYILHKDGKPYIETGSVTAVSAPRPKYPIPGAIGQIPQMETVVDVTVLTNGQSVTLQGLPAQADIADSPGHERRGVVHEVQEREHPRQHRYAQSHHRLM